jgi:protein-tyrosine phosphatase
MEHGLAELRAEIEARHLAIAVLPGAEIEADRLPLLTAQARRRLSLAGSGRFLLVELPWDGLTAEIAQSVTALAEDGLTPVIAHPERHPFVQEAPARAAAFVERGALFQVTVSSLIGHHGGATRRTARELLELGLVHLLASDGHGAAFRRAGLAEARGAVHDAAMLEWLTQSVPAAIVAGEAPPSAPAVSRPLGRFRRRLLKKWR